VLRRILEYGNVGRFIEIVLSDATSQQFLVVVVECLWNQLDGVNVE